MSGIVRANNAGQSGIASNVETIDSDDYVDGSVDTAHIANDQVTGAKLNPSLVLGDIIYADGTDTIAKLVKGDEGEVLTMGGSNAPTWAAASSGAISRSGGFTGTEGSSTSTSSIPLLTSSTLAIPSVSPFNFILSVRKTAGAADDAGLGWGMTVSGGSDIICRAAMVGNNAGWFTNTADQAQNGLWIMDVAARLTNYTSGVQAYSENKNASSGSNIDGGRNAHMTTDAIMPIGVVVEVIIYGITDNPANSLHADEFNIYEAVTS
jgi:hypothetical protein